VRRCTLQCATSQKSLSQKSLATRESPG